jgi:hypothetical protein
VTAEVLQAELQRVGESLVALDREGALRAHPERARAFMVEVLSLAESHLPSELLVTLRTLQSARTSDAALAESMFSGLGEERLACWQHLQACACYGSGVEANAVRALLSLLEASSPDVSSLSEVVRLVAATRPPSGGLSRALESAFRPGTETGA